MEGLYRGEAQGAAETAGKELGAEMMDKDFYREQAALIKLFNALGLHCENDEEMIEELLELAERCVEDGEN